MSILALLGAENRGELSRTWIEQIRDTFRADAGVLLWMDTHSEDEAARVADKLTRQGESFSGVLRPEEMRALFNTEAIEGSAAVSPVRHGEQVVGVLAVASHDPRRYQPEDGTLFLDYLAEVVGQLPSSQR